MKYLWGKLFGKGKRGSAIESGAPKSKSLMHGASRRKRNEGEGLVAMTEIPPMVSARRAVQVQVVKDANGIK
jgi:hypothetical protein